MAVNTKIILAIAYTALFTVVRSFGHNGNRYIRRGYAQEFGPDIFDYGNYAAGHVNPYSQNNGQGHNLGRTEYQGGNIFNPYQKLGYGGYQYHGFNGGLGFRDGGQMFGVPQPVNFVGNHRHRLI